MELNSTNTRKKNVHSNGRGCRARFSSDCSCLMHLAFVVVPKSYPEKVLSQADIRPSQREIQLNSFRLFLKHKLAVASGREELPCRFGAELVLKQGLWKHAHLQSCVVVCDTCSHKR